MFIADSPTAAKQSSQHPTRAHARRCTHPRAKSKTCIKTRNCSPHRNQQYSIIALTNGSGTITERYAYSAYGTPTITDASGTVQTSSADNNRYTYTGREWDSELSLYHYRARMYDSVAGRFCSRDPIKYEGSPWNFYQFLESNSLDGLDPSGNVTLDLPAKGWKCNLAMSAIRAYALLFAASSYDWQLVGHYGQFSGTPIYYGDLGPFDPDGSDQRDLATQLFMRLTGPKDFTNLFCDTSASVGSTSVQGLYHNNVTAMVSHYHLKASGGYSLKKTCDPCPKCSIEYSIVFSAHDTINFDRKLFGTLGFYVTDRLIEACGKGKDFEIYGGSTQVGEVPADCNSPIFLPLQYPF